MASPFEADRTSDEPRSTDLNPASTPPAGGPTRSADPGRRITPWHILSLLAFLLSVLALVAAYLQYEQHRAATATAPAPSSTESLTAEVAGLKRQIDDLSAKLQGARERVDNRPKPESAAELTPIRDKVDELARSVAAVRPVGEEVGTLGTRVGEVDAALKSLKEELSGLAGEVRELAAAKPAPAGPAEAASQPATDVPDLKEGIDLFKAGKYTEAGDVFKKIESARPDDARVYYYQAFINGLTTKDWKGETLKLAARGAELEKSGATKSADVDAAFSGLSPNLKSWLAFFRSQAR